MNLSFGFLDVAASQCSQGSVHRTGGTSSSAMSTRDNGVLRGTRQSGGVNRSPLPGAADRDTVAGCRKLRPPRLTKAEYKDAVREFIRLNRCNSEPR